MSTPTTFFKVSALFRIRGVTNQLLWRFKVWCFQYGVITRLQRPFHLYDVPMSQVEGMERMQQVLVKMVKSPSIFQLNQPEQQDLQDPLASVIGG